MDGKEVAFEKMTEHSENGVDDSEYKESFFSKRVNPVLYSFAERTSMHGCGYIHSSRGRKSKIAWSILTFLATLTLIIHLYMITDQYIKWPVKTTVSLEFNNLRFPAVTICNVNTLKKSTLPKLGNAKLRAMVEAVDPGSLLKTINAVGSTTIGNFSLEGEGEQIRQNSSESTEGESRRKKRSVSELYDLEWSQFEGGSDIAAMGTDSVENDTYTDRSSLAIMWDVFRLLFMQLSKEDRAASGHNISDMLLDCMFNGRICSASDFSLYQTPSFGNCYTIDSERMFVQRPGPDGGLTLLLFLQTKEFLDGITGGFGIKVIVHEPGTVPLPDDDGVFVAAASETDIALKRTEISRLGSPWGNCETGSELRETFRLNYTVKLCHTVCQAAYILKECECWHYMYEMIAEHTDRSFNICSTSSERRCVNDATDRFYRKEFQCECKNPCFDAHHTLSLSSRQWPSEAYAAILKESVCRSIPEECTDMRSFSTHQDLQKNFLLLNIYYETLNFESIVEEPLIDPFTFLSSIGGALGLWIGLSMLSLCEVLQLMSELIMCLFSKFGKIRLIK